MTQQSHVAKLPDTDYLSVSALQNDEIDLMELFAAIWQRKWLIVFSTLLGATVAVAIALSLPNVYTASATLAPSEEQQGGGVSSLAGQLGGLASLASVNLGGSGATDKTSVAIAVANSRQFMVKFVRTHQLEVPLMAGSGIDKKNGNFLINKDIYDEGAGKWIREVPAGKSQVPTDWELFKEISKVISMIQDKKSGFITVVADYYSPVLAKQWVDWFVADLNTYMKNRDQKDAMRNISYLKQQLDKTSVADMQTVFYQLIEQQTKTLMLSEVNPEYVFKTLDPAVVAEEKTKPKRALIVVLGAILGGMSGVIIALVRHAVSRRKLLAPA